MKSNFTYKINMTMKLKTFHLITTFWFEFMAQFKYLNLICFHLEIKVLNKNNEIKRLKIKNNLLSLQFEIRDVTNVINVRH